MRPLDSFGQRLLPGLRQALKDQPGALVLCDSFEGPGAHGNLVAQVARQQGFAGKLVALPFEDPNDPAQAEIGRLVQAWGEAETPEAIRTNLAESMVQTRLSAVQGATQRLLAVSEAGARQVAVNFSLGSTPALCVAAVLGMTQDPESAEQATSQLRKAFGEDFQAGLVELAGRTTHDPRLQEARLDFAGLVRQFEAADNEVVVAAGNDGRMAAWAPGFTLSDLVTPETTVVGALEGGKPASYNGEGVTVLAPGGYLVAGQEVHGTSFAAPVVAAALASQQGRKISP
ncbi:MAG: S8 family serine peptidase [Candidatus Eremiobacteraeota bacterium]|nr:S8 family serine peptidase [Candidatus Eremiobacteraeota bacterium]